MTPVRRDEARTTNSYKYLFAKVLMPVYRVHGDITCETTLSGIGKSLLTLRCKFECVSGGGAGIISYERFSSATGSEVLLLFLYSSKSSEA